MSKITRLNKQVSTKSPTCGKLKIGEKDDKRGFPKALDYFIIDSLPEFKQSIISKYGEKPNAITIAFATNDDDKNISYYLICRDPKNGKVLWEGDGTNFLVYDQKAQGRVPVTAPSQPAEYNSFVAKLEAMGDVKRRVTIRFVVLVDDAPIIQPFEFSTSGEQTSIDNILGSYNDLREMRGRDKAIAGVPFTLTVQIHKSQQPHAQARQYPVVNLIANLHKIEDAIRNIKMTQYAGELLNDLTQAGIELPPSPEPLRLAAPEPPKERALPPATVAKQSASVAKEVEFEAAPEPKPLNREKLEGFLAACKTADEFGSARAGILTKMKTVNEQDAAYLAERLERLIADAFDQYGLAYVESTQKFESLEDPLTDQ